MKKLFIGFIKLYRLTLSPFIGQQCRFEPSCSRYCEEAIEKHGAFKGVLLGIKRIGRCHPWAEGGIDPVPENINHTHQTTCEKNHVK